LGIIINKGTTLMLDESGKSSFQSLQAALGEGGDRASIVAYVFDLLLVDPAAYRETPFEPAAQPFRNR